jgi:hypothetical protein
MSNFGISNPAAALGPGAGLSFGLTFWVASDIVIILKGGS